jgi:predicted Zn-ribbon and HTH transcriptional regulator
MELDSKNFRVVNIYVHQCNRCGYIFESYIRDEECCQECNDKRLYEEYRECVENHK